MRFTLQICAQNQPDIEQWLISKRKALVKLGVSISFTPVETFIRSHPLNNPIILNGTRKLPPFVS